MVAVRGRPPPGCVVVACPAPPDAGWRCLRLNYDDEAVSPPSEFYNPMMGADQACRVIAATVVVAAVARSRKAVE